MTFTMNIIYPQWSFSTIMSNRRHTFCFVIFLYLEYIPNKQQYVLNRFIITYIYSSDAGNKDKNSWSTVQHRRKSCHCDLNLDVLRMPYRWEKNRRTKQTRPWLMSILFLLTFQFFQFLPKIGLNERQRYSMGQRQ